LRLDSHSRFDRRSQKPEGISQKEYGKRQKAKGKKNFECNNFAFFFASPIIFGLRDDRLLLSQKPYLFIQRGKILPSADLASLAASGKQALVRYC
jgi:hypothetical protein